MASIARRQVVRLLTVAPSRPQLTLFDHGGIKIDATNFAQHAIAAGFSPPQPAQVISNDSLAA